MLRKFDKRIASRKAATEGTAAGSFALLLGLLVRGIRARYPGIPWDLGTDAALVGAATGIFAAGFRFLRSKFKRHFTN